MADANEIFAISGPIPIKAIFPPFRVLLMAKFTLAVAPEHSIVISAPSPLKHCLIFAASSSRFEETSKVSSAPKDLANFKRFSFISRKKEIKNGQTGM